MRYIELENQLNTARNQNKGKPVGRNTRLFRREDGAISIRLYDTDIVVVNKDNSLELYTGGFRTHTTKERINRFIPCTLFQKNHQWYLGNYDKPIPFYEGIKLNPNGTLKSKNNPHPDNSKLKKRILKYIDGFVKHCIDGKFELPSGGDCWVCCGLAIGDNTEHLLTHMTERYYVPRLLYEAIKERGYNAPLFIQLIKSNPNREVRIIRDSLLKYMFKRLLK
jgi:hypothetical protein